MSSLPFVASFVCELSLCDDCSNSGAVGVETSAAASEGSDVLCGAVNAVEGAVDSVKAAVGGASAVLELLHEGVFPEKDVPQGLGPLAGAFDKDGDFLEGFVHDNVVSGLETAFMVLMCHGVSIDYDTVVSTVPEYTDEQGLWASDLARHLQKVVEEHARAREDVE